MRSMRPASIVCAVLLVSACSFDTNSKMSSVPQTQDVAALPAIMPATGSSFSELARKALAIGDAAAALPLAQRAVEAAPDDREANSILAEALLGTGRADDAEKIFNMLLAANSSDAGARTGRAMALLAMGQPAAAKADLLTVIAAKPPVAVLSNAGLALALAGDPKAAAAALAPTAFASDSTPQLRQNYALALTLSGDRATAYKVAEFDLGNSRALAQVNSWYLSADKPLAQQLAALTGLPSQSGASPAQMAAVALPAVAEPAKAEPANVALAAQAPELPQTQPATDTVVAAKPDAPLSLLPDPAPKAAPSAKAVVIRSKTPPASTAITSISLRPVSFKQAGFTASSAAPAALRGWLVQVASVSPDVSGKLLIQRLRKQFGSFFGKLGPVTHSKASVGARTVKRVFVGPYRTARQASSICARIKARGSACLVRPAATPASKPAAETRI
jgi:Flp pilus assembly protein TadD